MPKINLNEVLSRETWVAGKIIPIVEGSARHRVVIHCSPSGRQTHEFKNGPGNTAAYVELTRPDGSWIAEGTSIVSIMPDGRFPMVVEQRPPQGRYQDMPEKLFVGDREIDLAQYGPYSSVEFAGGAIDPEHKFGAGFLTELIEETGVEPRGTLYRRKHPIYTFGSDIALQGWLGVMFLSDMTYKSFNETDGGLTTLLLTEADVRRNIRAGNIRSAQAALQGWGFYLEVKEMLDTSTLDPEYVSQEEVAVALKKKAA